MSKQKEKRLTAKPKVNIGKTFKRLSGYFKGDGAIVVFGIAFSIISAIFYLIAPMLLGTITTEVFSATQASRAIDFNFIWGTIIVLIWFYVGDTVFNYLSNFMMTIGLQNTVYRLRKSIQGKFQRLPLKYFDSKPFGEILSTVTNDVDAVVTALQQIVLQLIRTIVQIVGVFIIMLYINPALTFVVFITVPISLFLSGVVVKRIQKYFVGMQTTLAKMNGYIEEQYTGFFVTKLYGREERALEDFEEINKTMLEYSDKSSYYSALMMALVRVVSNLGYAAVAVIGAFMVVSGQPVLGAVLTVGNLQAFIDYSRKFTMPMNQIAEMGTSIQSAAAAAQRIFEFLDEDELATEVVTEKLVKDHIEGKVSFKHVEFKYDPDTPLIPDLNAEILPGQTVAIVGHTGAGKTTLINLLMRFYEINSGDIQMDDKSIYSISSENLREQIGMVLQDAWLFEGTVRDNIAYGNRDATDAEIIHAADTAYADHFIRTLPKGYDTVIEEDGGGLSHGQKQLITIARAVVANPSVLILDEATSSVDTRTEVLIQEAMRNVMKGRTSFVIAHRLSTIKGADMIFVMENGNIVEQGNHDTLIKLNRIYADLYNSQFAEAS